MEKVIIALAQFISSILMVRFLGNEGVGILAIAGGIFSFISIVNISWESILLRNNVVKTENLQNYFDKFLFFNILKSITIMTFAIIAGLAVAKSYQNQGLLWAILSYALICVLDIIISPFIILCSTQYKQKVVTAMVMLRWGFHLILLTGFLKWPTLEYALIKECLLLFVMIGSWGYVGHKYLHTQIKIKVLNGEDWSMLKRHLSEFALWTHLTSVSAQILYRVDALILSFFAPLSVVGQYGIALSAANAAYIIPSVLSYQNAVVNSQVSSEAGAKEITNLFFKISGLVGTMIFVGYLVFGNWYLNLMTKDNASRETYHYLLAIVVGVLIIKTLVSTLVSYINSRGNVKRLFLFVSLPTLVGGLLIYSIACYLGQGMGISLANIVVSLLWLALSLCEMRKYGFTYKTLFYVSERRLPLDDSSNDTFSFDNSKKAG